MHETSNPFLKILKGIPSKRKPVWFMRQAGRYLPEYRKLREQTSEFISFCLNPVLASEATLQPIKRFNVDAAILFADILLVPYALGQKVKFIEGQGPILEGDEEKLEWKIEKISPVFETINRVKKELPEQTALIGFAGSPWTIACYMIEGKGGNGFPKTRSMAFEDKPKLEKLIETLVEASFDYLSGQIQSGAEAIQLFDSHAGLLAGEEFQKFVIEPTQRIVKELKKKHPSVPIIGFPREAKGEDKKNYFMETGLDALSLDQKTSANEIRELKKYGVLQGNMDPEILLRGGEEMLRCADEICELFGTSHIFNLGHGVLPQTPPEHVLELVSFIQNREVEG